mmetsp:Transcript_6799/g.20225  ORF Transcript_6799/g.20225 Transcript_6799/m.20225 type:complete len:210 (-) Transcript_6799:1029-1658(-)
MTPPPPASRSFATTSSESWPASPRLPAPVLGTRKDCRHDGRPMPLPCGRLSRISCSLSASDGEDAAGIVAVAAFIGRTAIVVALLDSTSTPLPFSLALILVNELKRSADGRFFGPPCFALSPPAPFDVRLCAVATAAATPTAAVAAAVAPSPFATSSALPLSLFSASSDEWAFLIWCSSSASFILSDSVLAAILVSLLLRALQCATGRS